VTVKKQENVIDDLPPVNTWLWDQLKTTDPQHTKQFQRAGGFKGTALKPMWTIMRMTQEFGPCGSGWGMYEPTFQVVPTANEILVFCTVGLWYRMGNDIKNAVYGVGGDKVLMVQSSGPRSNDEAFKAAYTDAMSNAMKMIGMGADIHMGFFDDQKYVREAAEHYQEQRAAPVAAEVRQAAPAPSGVDSEALQKLRESYAAIVKAIPMQPTVTALDRMMALHTATLAEIKAVNAEGYDIIMQKAMQHQAKLLETEQQGGNSNV
jgi:hypothetical protein